MNIQIEYFNILKKEHSKVIDIKELDLSIEETTHNALKEGYEDIKVDISKEING